ncbi:MAG: diadenosine tetraphosphatase, partial [Pseudomonadota bacterium]
PGWTLSQAHELADEFHAVLHGANYASYFTHMYGNSPAVWDDSLTGYDRLRFIVNAFTRMRFIDHQGALDMAHSGPLGSQPDHLLPWFERANCLPENTQLYFGHWAALQPFDSVHFFALDTGCVWGNALSAIELNSGQRISIPCDGVLRYSAKA